MFFSVRRGLRLNRKWKKWWSGLILLLFLEIVVVIASTFILIFYHWSCPDSTSNIIVNSNCDYWSRFIHVLEGLLNLKIDILILLSLPLLVASLTRYLLFSDMHTGRNIEKDQEKADD